jgi:hypothetical protein
MSFTHIYLIPILNIFKAITLLTLWMKMYSKFKLIQRFGSDMVLKYKVLDLGGVTQVVKGWGPELKPHYQQKKKGEKGNIELVFCALISSLCVHLCPFWWHKHSAPQFGDIDS